MLWTLLIVLLILALLGGPYMGWHSYGWGPSGLLGVVLVILLVLALVGRL
jgi:hypothetical protein